MQPKSEENVSHHMGNLTWHGERCIKAHAQYQYNQDTPSGMMVYEIFSNDKPVSATIVYANSSQRYIKTGTESSTFTFTVVLNLGHSTMGITKVSLEHRKIGELHLIEIFSCS